MYSSMLIKTDPERNIHVAIMRNLQELIVIFFFFFLREEKEDLHVNTPGFIGFWDFQKLQLQSS